MAVQKKVPVRLCIACRTQKPKKELIRIVKDKEGNISLDFTGKKAGRGAYICDSLDCLKKCVKGKILNRAFEMNIPDEVYEKLLSEYEQTKN